MAPDDDEELEFEPELSEEPIHGPDGSMDCIDGRYAFIEFWLAKLGVEPEGSALTFGENCSVSILHPITGEWMTPQEIAKRANASATVRRIQ